jgi:hypothetical protein
MKMDKQQFLLLMRALMLIISAILKQESTLRHFHVLRIDFGKYRDTEIYDDKR